MGNAKGVGLGTISAVPMVTPPEQTGGVAVGVKVGVKVRVNVGVFVRVKVKVGVGGPARTVTAPAIPVQVPQFPVPQGEWTVQWKR
jgi:hypothetical protein